MAVRWPKTKKFLRDKYIPLFLDLYKSRLIELDKVNTGDLVDEAKMNIRSTPSDIDIIFSNVDYWEVMEVGRSAGTYAPPESIQFWVRTKPIIPEVSQGRNKLGQFTSLRKAPTEKQLAFLVNRKLFEKGIPGTFAYADAQAQVTIQLGDELNAVIAEDIADEIASELQSIRKITIG